MARRTQVEQPGGTLLVTFVCAVLGGLAATPFWHLGPWQLALIVLLSALIGTCVAFSPLTATGEGAEPDEYLGGARPLAGEPPHPPSPVEPGDWWTERPAAPQGRHARIGEAAPPLSGYPEASPLIAQCPECGEFRLDVSEHGRAFAFQCRNPGCANTWSWTPGTPWPPVVVRRTLAARPAVDQTGHERG